MKRKLSINIRKIKKITHNVLKIKFTIHKLCNILTTEFEEGGGKKVMIILKEFRENLKLTQNTFAENLGVSTSLYTKIEARIEKAKQGIYS